MSIARNSAWNMVGVVVPTIITIPSLAIYSRSLGVEFLGLLMLTFSIMGYASSLDFGLSRALIRQVSIHLDDITRVKEFVGTTAIFIAGISVVLTVAAWMGSGWIVDFLRVSPHDRTDAVAGFHWLSLSIPSYLLSLVGTAYFEGKEDFKTLNLVRSAMSGLNAVAGVWCVYWTGSFSAVVAALCASRLISCIAIFALYRRDANRRDQACASSLMVFRRSALASSLAYGGWLTVSNVVGSITTYFDRFVLSHMSGAALVAFYTVPSEVVNRLLLIPAAISRALFPRLSKRRHGAASDRRMAVVLTVAVSIAMILPVYAFAGLILRLWMGPAYGGEPAIVLRILLVGFLCNSLAFSPFTDLQARGFSKITAYIHLGEVLPYIGALILLTYYCGIRGTAIAWSVRTLVDWLLMEGYARSLSGAYLE